VESLPLLFFLRPVLAVAAYELPDGSVLASDEASTLQ